MERIILIRLSRIHIIALTACLCLFSFNSLADSSQRALMLVCSQDSGISELTPIEIRKLFLGVPVMRNGEPLKPLRNATDPLITEVFLQKVIFMSEQSYERELLSRVYRLGGERPEIYSKNSELVNELREIPGTLTYMWSDEVEDTTGLKSLAVIWKGSIN